MSEQACLLASVFRLSDHNAIILNLFLGRSREFWFPETQSIPVDWRKLQAPPLHFFAKLFSISLHAFTNEAEFTACLLIDLNLPSNVFIICYQPFALHLRNIHLGPGLGHHSLTRPQTCSITRCS